MNVFDYVKECTAEDFDRIYEGKKDIFDKIYLKDVESNDLLDSLLSNNLELKSWIKEFNNRSFDLCITYTKFMNYYLEGIPDDEWYISPGSNGESIEYFPDFSEEDYIKHYWFGFYVDSFYTRFFGIIDIMYHILNLKYNLGINEGMGFNGNVSQKLKVKDVELYNHIEKIRSYDSYKAMSNFRNDITHNYRKNQIDSGVTRSNENGKITITYGVGKYTTTKKFVENIHEGISLLANLIDGVKEKIEK